MVEKKLPSSIELQRQLIEPDHPNLSVRRQCELLGFNRSTWYYQLAEESLENLRAAHDLPSDPSERAHLALYLARALVSAAQFSEACDLIEEAIAELGMLAAFAVLAPS